MHNQPIFYSGTVDFQRWFMSQKEYHLLVRCQGELTGMAIRMVFYCGECSRYGAWRNNWNTAFQWHFCCCFITTLQGFSSSWWKQKADESRIKPKNPTAHLAKFMPRWQTCLTSVDLLSLSYIMLKDILHILVLKRKNMLEELLVILYSARHQIYR